MARSAAVGTEERQLGVGPLIEGESATYVTSEALMVLLPSPVLTLSGFTSKLLT